MKTFAKWLFPLCGALLAMGAQAQRRTLIFDNDGSELLLNTYWNEQPLTLWQLDSLVDIQRDTQVGTYAICAGSDFFYYRSQYGRLYGDDLDGQIAHGGNEALYRTLKKSYDNAVRLEKEGTDLIRATLTRARKSGMQTMLTLRMNDLHFTDTAIDCPVAYNEWWAAHPELHTGDPSQGWHSAGAYDFAHKEVRDRKVAVIKEQIARYGALTDVYLVDFMRFFCYFRRGEGAKHADDMTQMMREIRQVIQLEGQKAGHPIKLAVRVAPSIGENMGKGLDIRQWLQENLIDLLSVGIHIRIEPNMPIRQLKADLGNDLHVPLYASTDMVTYQENEPVSEGMMRGFCMHALAQGADGVYLFNYFFNDYNRGRYHTEPGGQTCRIPHPRMLHELGSRETLEGRNKIYWLSDGKREYGLRPNTPLPLCVQPQQQAEVSLFVGDRVDSIRPKELILFYRTRQPASLRLWLNGKKAMKMVPDYVSIYNKGVKLQNGEQQYAVRLPAKALKQGDNVLRIENADTASEVTIKRIELALKYGSADTHGYF